MFKSLVGWAVFLILAAATSWYIFIKDYDYSISFKTNQAPGEIYHHLLSYNFENISQTTTQERHPFKQLAQNISLNGEKLELTWIFSPIEDSLTKVTARVNHLENSYLTRFKILVGKEEAQKVLKDEIQQFQKDLKLSTELFKVNITGEALSPATTCACMALENEVKNKAFGMMKNIHILSNFILHNNIQTTGRPRVNVKTWNLKLDTIEFEFCFPIAPEAAITETGKIYIKDFPARPSIKAIFNGNYMYSHLAWVKLLDYAELNKLKVVKQPLEVFNNNPEMGGDATRWEAEIYMPLE